MAKPCDFQERLEELAGEYGLTAAKLLSVLYDAIDDQPKEVRAAILSNIEGSLRRGNYSNPIEHD